MPPQRTIPPAKAIKTERTHEENQERAYIAASRRSDRSLEARVESARRASEIHKRRTGRSLRVTEQDVVNEEMYEEEDDDLPLQYRRLTAHLQTGSMDFNRRLAAYLTNHVAMRSALDQAITNSYAQQYPNAPQFAHNQQSTFPSPLVTQNLQQQPQLTQSPVAQSPRTTHHSPATYRSSPYPTPGSAGYRPNHHRSISTSVTHEVPGFMQNFPTPQSSADAENTARCMSTPASTGHSPYLQHATSHQSASATSSPILPRKSPPTATSSMQPPPKSSQPAPPPPDLGLLTMQLPMESQMMLNPVLDPNDSLTSKMMAGSEFLPGSFFNSFLHPTNGQDPNSSFFNFNTDSDPKFHPSYDGMNATLAPSALNLGTDYSANTGDFGCNQAQSSSVQPQDTDLWYGGLNASDHKGVHFPNFSQGGSGNVTPGENAAWDAFIDSEQWAESGS